MDFTASNPLQTDVLLQNESAIVSVNPLENSILGSNIASDGVSPSSQNNIDALSGVSNNHSIDGTSSDIYTDQSDNLDRGSDSDITGIDSTDMLVGTNQDESISIATPTPQSSNGAVYYVSTSGSDDNSGSKDNPWRSIDYAVSEESPIKAGDTVLVEPGTYTELVTLGKSGSESNHITLKANGDVTLRDPDPNSGDFPEGVIHSPGESNWVIDGFRIENTSWAGISLSDAKNITVQNNETYQTGSSGIIVLPKSYFGGGEDEVTSSNVKILNNTIERANWKWDGPGDTNGLQEAMSIWGVDGFEVANNTLKEGKREGIDIKVGSRNGSIHSNTISGQALISGTSSGFRGGPAIYVDGNRADSFNLDIYNNEVFSNTADGILIGDEVPFQGDVSDINIYNNVVYGNGQQNVNGGRGIAITNNVQDVEIVNNTLVDNVQGVHVDNNFNSGYNPRDILIRNNILADNTYRNASIEDAMNVTLDNNLFTDTGEDEKLYDGGNGVGNLNAYENEAVESVGFVNPGAKDYRVTSTSKAIDTGSSSIADYAKVDKNGKNRPSGAVDMGAYEY